MSGPETMSEDTPRNDATLSGEYALGLLEGEELLKARGRLARDPEFSAHKSWWDERLAPLTDEIAGMEPSADLWSRIEAEIAGRSESGGAEVVDLQARLTRWKWTAAITSMAAVLMLAVLILPPGSEPGSPVAGGDTLQLAANNPLVASMPIGNSDLRLGITYLPGSEEMLVSASGLTADGIHDHELWLVPEDGSGVQSLGVIVAGEERRVAVPAEVSGNMGDGVQVLLTREPLGGKPEDRDPGPVVGQANLATV